MYGYAFYKMSHDELYEMDVQILGEMFRAVISMDDRKLDLDMQKLSWQTAILMNATGNYKSPVEPEDLYTPIANRKEEKLETVKNIEVQRKEKQEELLKSFELEITSLEGSSDGN